MTRKTHRSKSHKRRHSRKHTRRHTRKRGGACGSCSMRTQFGGRGGMGGADVGHAYTTGATQELNQMMGGSKGNKNLDKRRAAKAAKLAAQAARLSKEAEALNNKAEAMENRAETLNNKANKMANAAVNAAATAGLMRGNAPEYVPSPILLATIETNRGMAAQKNYLNRLMRTPSEENANNFNALMRKVHKNRMNNKTD